jgi:hypothetical protein
MCHTFVTCQFASSPPHGRHSEPTSRTAAWAAHAKLVAATAATLRWLGLAVVKFVNSKRSVQAIEAHVRIQGSHGIANWAQGAGSSQEEGTQEPCSRISPQGRQESCITALSTLFLLHRYRNIVTLQHLSHCFRSFPARARRFCRLRSCHLSADMP